MMNGLVLHRRDGGGNTGGKNAEASRLTPLKSLEALGSKRREKTAVSPSFIMGIVQSRVFPVVLARASLAGR